MDAPKSYYLYSPSEPLAGVVAGLYGVSFCITLWQIIRKKAWVWLFMLLAIASKSTFGQMRGMSVNRRCSGDHRLRSSSRIRYQADRKRALRPSIHACDPTPSLDGRCHLCYLR